MDSSFKNKNAKTITNSFENHSLISKRKSNLIETDHGIEFENKILNDPLKKQLQKI